MSEKTGLNAPEEHGVNCKEEELVRLAVAGDTRAFEALANLYGKPLFKLAYGFFYNREDAMDIVQETSLKMYRFIGSYRMGTSFRNWVFRIATNICIDLYRKNRRGRNKEDSLDNCCSELEDRSDNSCPASIFEQNFNDSIVKSGIEGLSKKQKTVFLLKHSSGMKFREIADLLKISEGTVKSLHHRALQRLKVHVQKVEGFDGKL